MNTKLKLRLAITIQWTGILVAMCVLAAAIITLILIIVTVLVLNPLFGQIVLVVFAGGIAFAVIAEALKWSDKVIAENEKAVATDAESETTGEGKNASH